MGKVADFAYHALIGNDTHPIIVAGTRALLAAALTGAISFLGVWQSTDDVKVLITSGVLPFLMVLATRLGIEGAVDNWKANR